MCLGTTIGARVRKTLFYKSNTPVTFLRIISRITSKRYFRRQFHLLFRKL